MIVLGWRSFTKEDLSSTFLREIANAIGVIVFRKSLGESIRILHEQAFYSERDTVYVKQSAFSVCNIYTNEINI